MNIPALDQGKITPEERVKLSKMLRGMADRLDSGEDVTMVYAQAVPLDKVVHVDGAMFGPLGAILKLVSGMSSGVMQTLIASGVQMPAEIAELLAGEKPLDPKNFN